MVFGIIEVREVSVDFSFLGIGAEPFELGPDLAISLCVRDVRDVVEDWIGFPRLSPLRMSLDAEPALAILCRVRDVAGRRVGFLEPAATSDPLEAKLVSTTFLRSSDLVDEDLNRFGFAAVSVSFETRLTLGRPS